MDRLPADSRLSYPVQQDQRLARSGSVMGEIVEGGRSQAGRDDVSLVGRNGFRAQNPSNSAEGSTIPPGVGGRSLERRDDLSPAQRAMAAAGAVRDPAGRGGAIHSGSAQRSSPVSNGCGLGHAVAGGPDSGLRVWAGFRWLPFETSGRSPTVSGTKSSSRTCGGCQATGPPCFPASQPCSQCAPVI